MRLLFLLPEEYLHRNGIRLLDAVVQDLRPKGQRVLEKFRLALRKAESISFLRDVDHGSVVRQCVGNLVCDQVDPLWITELEG